MTLLPDGRFLFEAFLEAALNEVAERIEQAGTDIGKKDRKIYRKIPGSPKKRAEISGRSIRGSMSKDLEILQKIRGILERGNTAEVKRRKNDIIVLEVRKKIVYEEDR